jgi:hypothetical protein
MPLRLAIEPRNALRGAGDGKHGTGRLGAEKWGKCWDFYEMFMEYDNDSVGFTWIFWDFTRI